MNTQVFTTMKVAFVFLITFVLSSPVFAVDNHLVRGYAKKNGTYVAPHRQTNPNRTQRDNWSSKGNTNPYTGKAGRKNPRK
jgi:hypothetical protein